MYDRIQTTPGISAITSIDRRDPASICSLVSVPTVRSIRYRGIRFTLPLSRAPDQVSVPTAGLELVFRSGACSRIKPEPPENRLTSLGGLVSPAHEPFCPRLRLLRHKAGGVS